LTWDYLQKIGLGVLGLAPEIFWDMTQREFWNCLEGYYENEEGRDRRDWIKGRWQTALFLNCFTTKENILQPKDLITFDWEKELEKPVEVPTIEDFERIKAKYGLK